MSNITHFTAVAVGINSHLSTDANMPEVANFATARKYLKRGDNDKILIEFHLNFGIVDGYCLVKTKKPSNLTDGFLYFIFRNLS